MNEPKVTYKFNQTLTNEEAERYAYISGDVKSADMFGSVLDSEEYTEGLETNISELEEELTKYKQFMDKLKDARGYTD